MTWQQPNLATTENVRVFRQQESTVPKNLAGTASTSTSAVPPFLLGTIVGGILGAVVGTALSPHTRGFLVGLYHLINRRLTSADRDQLRFELLLQ